MSLGGGIRWAAALGHHPATVSVQQTLKTHKHCCTLSAVLQGLFISLQPPRHDGGSAITGFSIIMRCNPLAAAAAAAAAFPGEHPPLMSSDWVEVWRGEYKGAAVPVLHLLPGTLYEFRAAACNAFGSSNLSEVAAATTLSAEPLPPQMPVVVSAAGSSLTVSWMEPYGQGSPVTKYKLAYACLGAAGGSGSAAANGTVSRNSAAPALANGHAEPGHAAESGGELTRDSVWMSLIDLHQLCVGSDLHFLFC